eukprot:TRINITY_DN148_c0_g1_i1.p1 TRINITY_DN148_c0_g1~~TRINITY_DN148_c0_g1_i1.p1  ORF type:complete len:388 (+),score=57.31 TRINITY_DN148_c0_g1_i1:123-1166(+)
MASSSEGSFLLDSKDRMDLRRAIEIAADSCLTETHLEDVVKGLKLKQRGKVRDVYADKEGQKMVLVTTDRQSAFDRVLAAIPFKGQVLNETSAWWFENTRHITANAFLAAPDPNVTIFRQCDVFPVEFVVRGFITGSTSTSLWTVYKAGSRNYCGLDLPEGLVKNERLVANVLTPTTKAEHGDEPVSPQEIVDCNLMSAEDFAEVKCRALALFQYGQEVAASRGLLLVDTKYEFGRDKASGEIVLLDEVHTPDSSRYWLAGSYEERHAQGLEPENIDKEFLRLWFAANCDPYKDEVLPAAPPELVKELSWRYIALYEAITGCRFQPPSLTEPIHDRICRNVSAALTS